jgi:hypothetical protein
MNNTTTRLAEIEVSYRPKKVHHPLIKSSADAYFHLLKFFPEETISLQESSLSPFLVGENTNNGSEIFDNLNDFLLLSNC